MLKIPSLKPTFASLAKRNHGFSFSGRASSSVVNQATETSTQMMAELESMRDSTEYAALSIGGLLENIVTLATDGNKQVRETIADAVGLSLTEDDSESASINDLVLQQVEVINNFMSKVSEFLTEQVELAHHAHAACETISKSATDVAILTNTSQVLSVNLQIEAARLGNAGSSFTALGQEVHSFSIAVREAADEINNSVEGFLQTIPKMRDKAIEMEEGVSNLSESFQSEMSALSDRTGKMHNSLTMTLDHVEDTNNGILNYSNETLSHLAFQDPVSQGLERIEHNVLQLRSAIEGKTPDFVSLAVIRDDVGEDGRTERAAGEVDLF